MGRDLFYFAKEAPPVFPYGRNAMTFKSVIMDAPAVERALRRISFEIIEHNKGVQDVCLVGVKRRGVSIAKKIRQNILAAEGTSVPMGALDITFYRDDLTEKTPDPALNQTEIPFDITGKTVVLCDDVIFTGRTARAAIDALFALGRPKAIRLAILVDRGHRELPIKADYVGKNMPTSLNERVEVTFPEYDGCEIGVALYEISR